MVQQKSSGVSIDITVLLPTRGRTRALDTSLRSLIGLADDPSSVEILLAFDRDDTGSSNYFQEHIAPWITEQGTGFTAYCYDRLGYLRLNEYINSLCRSAQGQWLFFWGDDAIMESQGWDREIRACEDFRVLRIPTHNQHPYAIFPIVPRAWFEVFGYFSPHQLNDTWVSQVGYMMDIIQNIPVTVTHDRFDITGNNNDTTYQNRPMLEGNPQDPRDFNHSSWRQRRIQDCERLAQHLESRAQDTSWWQTVKAGKQDPWAKMCSLEYDPNNQVKQR